MENGSYFCLEATNYQEWSAVMYITQSCSPSALIKYYYPLRFQDLQHTPVLTPLSSLPCPSSRWQSNSVPPRMLPGTLRVVSRDLGATVGATHLHPDHAVPQPQQSQQGYHQFGSRWEAHLFTRGAAQPYRPKPFGLEQWPQWGWSGRNTSSTLFMCTSAGLYRRTWEEVGI